MSLTSDFPSSTRDVNIRKRPAIQIPEADYQQLSSWPALEVLEPPLKDAYRSKSE